MIDLNSKVWNIQNIDTGEWHFNVQMPLVEVIDAYYRKGNYRIWAEGCDDQWIKLVPGEFKVCNVANGVSL